MAFLYPVIQFFDDNGSMLSNGTITTYQANTDTPLAAYTNQGASTPLENPILLDSTGRPQTSGSIWLSGSYTIIVQDNNGKLVGKPINYYTEYDTVDFTGLTATVAGLNSAAVLGSTVPGVVLPGLGFEVDSSKNIGTFGTLTSASLIANTGTKTPTYTDSNTQSALYIQAVASQVNALTVIPAVTGSSPALNATGSDSNISLNLNPQSSGAVSISGITYPITDGSNTNQLISNGTGGMSIGAPNNHPFNSTDLYNTFSNLTYTQAWNNSIPLVNSTDQYTSVTYTPQSATSTLFIKVNITCGHSGSGAGRNIQSLSNTSASLANVLTASFGCANSSGLGGNVSFCYTMTPGSTNPITFYLNNGGDNSNCGVNGKGGTTTAAIFGGVCCSSMVITEF